MTTGNGETGEFVGTGSSNRPFTVGWQPKFIIMMDDWPGSTGWEEVLFKTDTMPDFEIMGAYDKDDAEVVEVEYLSINEDRGIRFDSEGFTIGDWVNYNDEDWYWMAWR